MGKVRSGTVGFGPAVRVGYGMYGFGRYWNSLEWQYRFGRERRLEAGKGPVGYGSRGREWLVSERCGMTRMGSRVMARYEIDRCATDWQSWKEKVR